MEAVDQRRVRPIPQPLLVGDRYFSLVPTGFFDHDSLLRRTLTSDERFEAFLRFREQALKIAAAQLVSASNSPADLFYLSGDKGADFGAGYAYGPGLSPNYVHDNDLTTQSLHYVYRSFAYRKSLLHLDFIQKDSDCEEVLKKLKSSTQWSELQDSRLRTFIQRHLKLLKEHDEISQLDSTTRGTSISESFKKFALEKINSELSSELDELLLVNDWGLMNQYCKRTKLNIFARECDAEAQMADVVILEEAVPIITDGYMEHMSPGSPAASKHITKQKVKQSMEGFIGSLRRMNPQFARGMTRGKAAFFAFSTFAVASATWKTNKE
ncbi:hypothetical protein ACP70R_008340 [Stipagrostis hirtigluma subsp. patula]